MPTAPLDAATVAAFEQVMARYNTLLEELNTVGAFIFSYVTTDTRDTTAQARLSEMQQQTVALAQLGTRFTAWIGSLDVDALRAQSAVAQHHQFMLEKAQVRAAHLMSPAEEALAAELDVSSAQAWGKLHDDLTSQLLVQVELPDGVQEMPMSAVRNLASEGDRTVRRIGYEAELAAWERAALPLAAAMNSIKGQQVVLGRRRGWESPLDQAAFENHIDRTTLEAMMLAAHESFPHFRRYLRAKARLLGLDQLAWYDLFAPLGGDGSNWAWNEARAFIEEQFGSYAPRMRDYAARAFGEHWIDAEPRPGKVGGAFCMGTRGDESRILTNFKPGFEGLSTLAHELGHGYHNLNLAARTAMQRDTPSTLAETASIFCETIIRHAGMKKVAPEDQIVILEAALQGSCQVVVDITSRYLFEQRVFEARAARELSVDEFNALMLDAQAETYGDGVDPALRHPYMWAVKGHYYRGEAFYNFPYMFGLLFGLGLYARYQADPDGFKESYDALLSSTGLADAATLAARFGIDTRTPDFWRASLALIKDDVDQFEALVAKAKPQA